MHSDSCQLSANHAIIDPAQLKLQF